MFTRSLAAIAASLFACPVLAQINPEFSYQGQLSSGGSPYTGSADVQFTLWSAATNGSAVSPTLTASNLNVDNGIFQTTLDFTSDQLFTNANTGPYYLEIAVRAPAGSGSYTKLAPRKPLSAVARASQVNGLTPQVGPGVPVAACGQGTQFPYINQTVSWQSFTPSKTIAGASLTVYLNQVVGQSAIFKLYSGDGINGTVLNTQTIPSTGAGMLKYTITLPSSVVLNAASIYTVSFINSNPALTLTVADSPTTSNWESNLPNQREITLVVAGTSVTGYSFDAPIATPAAFDGSPSITADGRVLIQPSASGAANTYPLVVDNSGGFNMQLAASGNPYGPSMTFTQKSPGSECVVALNNQLFMDILPTSGCLYLIRNGDPTSAATQNANSRLVLDGHDSVYASIQSFNESGLLFGAGGDGTNGGIIYNNGGTRQMQFRTNGNVTRMTISPTGVITGNFNNTSSARYKTDIVPMENSLQTLMNLRGVRFNWDQAHGGTPSAGFIAEEVAAALPTAAVKNDDGTVEGINVPALVALSVEAIKQQQAEHADESTKLTRLEHENTELRARLDRLEALLKSRAN